MPPELKFNGSNCKIFNETITVIKKRYQMFRILFWVYYMDDLVHKVHGWELFDPLSPKEGLKHDQFKFRIIIKNLRDRLVLLSQFCFSRNERQADKVYFITRV